MIDRSVGTEPTRPEGREDRPEEAPAPSTGVSRPLAVLAWSTGPAAVYALLGLLHAALQRELSVEVGFGRSLAFPVTALYLALALWGFLPGRPSGWYVRRTIARGALVVGLLGVVVCGGFVVSWLARHATPSVAIPVLGCIAVLAALAVLTLRLAGRAEDGW